MPMKVVMINDCAYVGETLLKYLPMGVQKTHIKRSRGAWSKTIGIFWKILRANADLYHAHYLLQDCYIAEGLGKKPLIGHAHGSDLRVSLQHWMWGHIVRHNLKKCNRILVSTPDVLNLAVKIRKDAEYLPNPIDEELFYPKPLRVHSEKLKVLIGSDCNWRVKGTDIAIKALAKIKQDVDVSLISSGVDLEKTLALSNSIGLQVNLLIPKPHDRISEYYWDADVVIDRFALGSMGLVSLEAIACGRPVLVYVSSEYPENRDFPLMNLCKEEEIAETLVNMPGDLWKREYEFVKRYHSASKIASRLFDIYKTLID
jgi:glycosyltransferase involved in cell wall biosynthesis